MVFLCGFQQFSNTSWVSYNSVQFVSDTDNLKLAQIPQVKAQSHKTAPNFRCQPQVGYFQMIHTSAQLIANLRAPPTPSRVSPFTRMIHRTQESAIFMIIVYYKGYKWTTRGRGTWGEGRRMLSAGTSVPLKWGCTTLLVHQCVHRKLSNLHCSRVFMEVPCIGMIDWFIGHWLLSSISSPPPFIRGKGVGTKGLIL